MTGTVILLTTFVLIGQAFGLSLFFFISTYFAPQSCDHKGVARFTTHRVLRLGIPMFIYYFLIGPGTIWFSNDRAEPFLHWYAGNVLSFRSTFFGPAWFLEALLYFTLVYAFIRAVGRRREPRRHIPFPNGRTLLVFAIVFGVIAFFVRIPYPVGTGPLELQLGFFPLYVLAMVAGVIAYRNDWLSQLPARLIRRWTIVETPIPPPLLPHFLPASRCTADVRERDKQGAQYVPTGYLELQRIAAEQDDASREHIEHHDGSDVHDVPALPHADQHRVDERG